jgi:hypothetical protein
MSAASTRTNSDDIVVFHNPARLGVYGMWGRARKGRWLRLEKERPLCLSCADLAHLVCLTSSRSSPPSRRSTRATRGELGEGMIR